MLTYRQNLQTHIIKMQQPYPLIVIDGTIYKQMATMLIPYTDVNLCVKYKAHPVVNGGMAIDGQVIMHNQEGDTDPNKWCRQLHINAGDKITWEQFIHAAYLKFQDINTYCSVEDLKDTLEDFDVSVTNLPKHLYIYIKTYSETDKQVNKNDVEFYSPNVFMHKHAVVGSEQYFTILAEIYEHLLIAPDAQIHVLYDHDLGNNPNISLMEKVKNTIMDEISDPTMEGEICHSCPEQDIIEIAETLHEKNNRWQTKENILNLLCSKLNYSSNEKEWIWQTIIDNGLLDPQKYG